jgi:hypothetical protein
MEFCLPKCLEPGKACSFTSDCCSGNLCVTNGTISVCAAMCASNAQCKSGCCAPVPGTGSSVCSPPSFCP